MKMKTKDISYMYSSVCLRSIRLDNFNCEEEVHILLLKVQEKVMVCCSLTV